MYFFILLLFIDSLKEKEIKDHCDGLLVFEFVTENEARYIKNWNVPYVFCQRAIHLTDFNHSATDNRAGGKLLGKITTKLYNLNYKIQELFPLIGYDNSTELLVLDKKPATIEIGIAEIYHNAAEALIKLIGNDIEAIDLVHSSQLLISSE